MSRRLGMARVITSAVALITVITVATSFVMLRSDKGRKALTQIVEGFADSALKQSNGKPRLDLTLGEMEIPGLTGVGLKNVEIALNGEKGLLKIPYVKFVYNPIKVLVGGKSSVSAISGIEMLNPELTLRRSLDGSWNIKVLLNQKKSGGNLLADATGTMKIKNGVLRIVGVPGLDDDTGLVNGTIKAKNGKLFTSGLKISLGKNVLMGSGTLDMQRGKLNVDVDVKNVDASDAIALLPVTMPRGISAGGGIHGKAYLRGMLSKPEVTYKIYSDSIPISTDKGMIPVKAVQVTGSYSQKGLSFSRANLSTGSTVLTAKGSINADKVLKLSGYLSTVSLEKDWPGLAAMAAWDGGRGRLDFRLSGSVSRPIMDLDLDVNRARILGVPVNNMAALGSYSDGNLNVSSGKAIVGGEMLAVRGDVGIMKGMPTSMYFSATNADVQPVFTALGYDIPIRGKASGMVVLSNNNEGKLALKGSVASDWLDLKGLDVTGIHSVITYNNGHLTLTDGSLRIGDAVGKFTGTMQQGTPMRINYDMSRFQLAELGRIDAKYEMSGVAHAKGWIDVGGDDIVSSGSVAVKKPEYGKITGDSLTANYWIGGTKLNLSDVTLKRGSARYLGAGNVAGSKIDAKFDVSGETLDDVVAMAGGGNLDFPLNLDSRRINGEVSVSGPLNSVNVDIDAGIGGPNLGIAPLKASVRFVIEDGKTRLGKISLPGLV